MNTTISENRGTSRTAQQDKRLLRLIEFLDKLPRQSFDFTSEVSEVKFNGETCATVACAIGWTPRVFPRWVKWHWNLDKDFSYFDLRNHDGRASYIDVADILFGVPREHDIFYPDCQSSAGVKTCGDRATPKRVAAMLRQYRKQFPARSVGRASKTI